MGDYICEVDVRNRDLKVKLSQGISNEKYFQQPKQVAINPYNDKIVRKGQFAFNRATTRNGNKISIAYREAEDCTVSASYCVFDVKNEDILSPKYLMMWFRRPEFDRYAIYHSHGSAHEYFTFENMCDVELPIPPIDQQRKIVAEYNAIQQRIKLNEQLIVKLEETAQAIYRKMFVDGIDKNNLPEGWRMGTLGEFGDIITGKTPSSNNPEDFGDDMLFITPGDFAVGSKFILNTERHLSAIGCERLKNKILPKGSVAVTCIGSDMGKVAIVFEPSITNQQINAIKVKENIYIDYLFYYLSSIKNELKAMALGSSTMPLLNKSDFENINIIIPHYPCLNEFSKTMSKINKQSLCATREIYKLIEIQFLLLTNMEG